MQTHRVLLACCVIAGVISCASQPAGTAEPEASTQAAREAEGRSRLRRFGSEDAGARAHLFGRVALAELLAIDSPGVWVRLGLDVDGEHAVLSTTTGAPLYNFSNPCPPTCPTGPGGELLSLGVRGWASDATAMEVARVGGQISVERARSLTDAYLGAHPGDPAAFWLPRAALERLLADEAVRGVWLGSGRDVTGERSVVVLPAGRTGALVPVSSSTAGSSHRFVAALSEAACTGDACPAL